jgi:hypothetical protein
VNNSKRINLYISRQLCVRMNICMWMDHAVFYKKTSALGGNGAKVIVTAKNGSFFRIYG